MSKAIKKGTVVKVIDPKTLKETTYVTLKDLNDGNEWQKLLKALRCEAVSTWGDIVLSGETFAPFTALEEMEAALLGWTDTPPQYEKKDRSTVSLEDIEAMATGKAEWKPDKLGRYYLEVLLLWRNFWRIAEGLERSKPKGKKKRLEEVGPLVNYFVRAAELLHEVNPKPVYATETFSYLNGIISKLITIWGLEEVLMVKPSVIRMAKGLSQQQLKTQGNRQPTLFDELESEWKAAILKEGAVADIQRSGGIIEGIDLEPDESALIDALHVMLHYQSNNTKDPKAENYLAASWQIDGRTAIHYTVTELARIYNGGTKPNGDEVARVQQVADRLAEKRFLMEYSERRPNGKKTIEATERVYAPLFEIRERTIKEGDRQGTRLFIRLHDIFRASIASRYIELPEDIRTRMSKAFGKASYTDYALRNYLLNEVSSRRKEATINRETAYERFCKPEWRPVRKQKRLNAALEGCKRLGLLESYEETTGQSGQLKLILRPFTDWSRNPMPLLENEK
jgi:hypothetical protein